MPVQVMPLDTSMPVVGRVIVAESSRVALWHITTDRPGTTVVPDVALVVTLVVVHACGAVA